MSKRPVHPFPSRGPRVMHGMARMLAAAQDLTGLGSSAAVPPHKDGGFVHQNQPGPHLDTPPDVDQDKLRKGLEVFKRLAGAERKVANVEKVIAAFAKQCEDLPVGHPMRTTIETMLQTFRDALAAGDVKEVAKS